MKSSLRENRVFERFPAKFPVKFKHSRDEYGSDVFLRDASAEGMRLTTKEHLFVNDKISVEVKIPDSVQPLILNGEVVWAKNLNPDLWEVGVRFHKIHLMRLQRLYKFVEEEAI